MSDAPQVEPPPPFMEPLPPWLEHELAVGRDKIPDLRAALIRAQLKCRGILHQEKRNQEQGYNYTGHDDVIEHVRRAMAEEGISVEQVTCDLERDVEIATRSGKSVAWVWRVICLVTHVSGASVVRIIRPLTVPNNKAAFVASTAADRTLLMRLMRLAGTKEDPDDEEPRRAQGSGRASAGPKQAPARTPSDAEQAELRAWVAHRMGLLGWCDHEAQLLLWGQVFNARQAPKAAKAAAWNAWAERAKTLKLDPAVLAAKLRKLPAVPEERIARAEGGELIDRETGEVLLSAEHAPSSS